MAELNSIVLGGKEITFRRLTMSQVRDIDHVLKKVSEKSDGLEMALDLMAIAFRRNDPPVTRDQLLDMEIDAGDLGAATDTIIKLVIVKKDTQAGEAPAANQ